MSASVAGFFVAVNAVPCALLENSSESIFAPLGLLERRVLRLQLQENGGKVFEQFSDEHH